MKERKMKQSQAYRLVRVEQGGVPDMFHIEKRVFPFLPLWSYVAGSMTTNPVAARIKLIGLRSLGKKITRTVVDDAL
jgi:hypothetical protein